MSSIKRKPHCLRAEKSLAIPRHFIFFDTETVSVELEDGRVEQKLKLGWACYYRKGYGRNYPCQEWHYFTTSDSFWQFVKSHIKPKIKLWLLARNIVFDFTVLGGWSFLRPAGFKLKFFYDAGCTSIISVTSKQGSIVFLDTMNWFVESVEETGKRIGIPKLKIDFDNCTDDYLSTYCRRDVEIEVENFKLFIKFLEANQVSRLCYTRGSTAMAAYLFRHYKRKIYIHNNEQAISLERDSYRGGRVECFQLGVLKDDNYYVIDVNSLYPFVMRKYLYPVKYEKMLHKPSIEDVQRFLVDKTVIAEALIMTAEPAYAVRRKRTIFPVGRFLVTLTTPELKYAIEHNHILKLGSAVVYEQADIFSTYVDRFYALRQEFKSAGVAEYEELCKKMLNSLYGKFGQKADIWKKIGECPNEPDRMELCFSAGVNRVKQIRYLLGEIFELEGYEECFNSFPAISSQVAAYGRMYLYKLIKQAGVGNYFYCDTDSLIVNEQGLYNLQPLLDENQLGYLKIVEQCSSIELRGLKDYTTGAKNIIKGISKNAIEIDSGVYEQQQWPSFTGMLQSGNVNSYTIKTVKKMLSRKYTKGEVMLDGLIRPLVLADSAESLFEPR